MKDIWFVGIFKFFEMNFKEYKYKKRKKKFQTFFNKFQFSFILYN